MTGNELYSNVKGMMADKQTTTINDQYILFWVNDIRRQLHNLDNDIRMFKDTTPVVYNDLISLDNQIDISTELNEALKYGVISLAYLDDDLQKYSIFNTRFQNEQIKNQVVVPKEMLEKWL